MKTIIVPVDFSEQSEYALQFAAEIARNQQAEILALHMLEMSPALLSTGDTAPSENVVFLLKLAEKRFADFLNKDYLQGVSITPVIKHFKVFSEINEIAEEQGADLIIMGSHGTDGLEEIFIGSNTEKVVRSSTVPVLVVKERHSDFSIDRFVFACDFEAESVEAAKKAQRMAELFGAEFLLVYINTPNDAFLSTKDAYNKISAFLTLARMGKEVEVYNDYTIEKGILNYAESVSADLIGIPTHGRKGLSHFLLGSISEDLANHSSLPVVTFKI